MLHCRILCYIIAIDCGGSELVRMSGFTVLFAIIIMVFIIRNDWSKLSKSSKWIPYFSIVFLSILVIHNFLIYFGIDIIKIAKEKQLIDQIINKIRF